MKTIFAQRIRELRREAGMSQEQLAAKCGITVQAVSKWECAQSYPDIELLVQLAEQFGVTVDSLLREEAPVRQETPPLAAPPVDWPEDGKLRVVQFVGRRMVSRKEGCTKEPILLRIESSDGNVEIWGNAEIEGDVGNNLTVTGGNITCGDIGNNATTAGGNICCGDIGNNATTAAGSIDCGDVGGNITTGIGGANCGDVGGNVTTQGGDLHCRTIQGDARCDGNILYDR